MLFRGRESSLQIEGLLGGFPHAPTTVHFNHVPGKTLEKTPWRLFTRKTTDKAKLNNKLVIILFIINLIRVSSFVNHLSTQKRPTSEQNKTRATTLQGTLALCLNLTAD